MGRYVTPTSSVAKPYGNCSYNYRCVYSTPGSYTFCVPTGVASVKAIVVGGGSPGSTGMTYSHAVATRCLPLCWTWCYWQTNNTDRDHTGMLWYCNDYCRINCDCSLGICCYTHKVFDYKEYSYAYTGSGGGYAEKTVAVVPGDCICVTVGGQGQTSSFGAYISATGASAPTVVRNCSPTSSVNNFCPCWTLSVNCQLPSTCGSYCKYWAMCGCLGSLCDCVIFGCPVTSLTFAPGVGCNGDKNYTGGCGSCIISSSLQSVMVCYAGSCLNGGETQDSTCRNLCEGWCVKGNGDCAWNICTSKCFAYCEYITNVCLCNADISAGCHVFNHTSMMYGCNTQNSNYAMFNTLNYSGSSAGSPLGDGKPGASSALNATNFCYRMMTKPSVACAETITCDQATGKCCTWYRSENCGCCFPGNLYRQHVKGFYCFLCDQVKTELMYRCGTIGGICYNPCHYLFDCLGTYATNTACVADCTCLCCCTTSYSYNCAGYSVCNCGAWCGTISSVTSWFDNNWCTYMTNACQKPMVCLLWTCINALKGKTLSEVTSTYNPSYNNAWCNSLMCDLINCYCLQWSCINNNTCCMCRTVCNGSVCSRCVVSCWSVCQMTNYFACNGGRIPQCRTGTAGFDTFVLCTCLPRTLIAPGSAGGPNSCGNPGCRLTTIDALVSGVGSDSTGVNIPFFVPSSQTKPLPRSIARCIIEDYNGFFGAWYMCNIWWNPACCNVQMFNPIYTNCCNCTLAYCGGTNTYCTSCGPYCFLSYFSNYGAPAGVGVCDCSPCTSTYYLWASAAATEWMRCNADPIVPQINTLCVCAGASVWCTCTYYNCIVCFGDRPGVYVNSYSQNHKGTPSCLALSSNSIERWCICTYGGCCYMMGSCMYEKAACCQSCFSPCAYACANGFGLSCYNCPCTFLEYRCPPFAGTLHWCFVKKAEQLPGGANNSTFIGTCTTKNSSADPYYFVRCEAVGAESHMCLINTCNSLLPGKAIGGGGCAGMIVCACCVQPVTNAPYHGGIFPCGTPGFGGGGTVMGSGGTGLVVVYWN